VALAGTVAGGWSVEMAERLTNRFVAIITDMVKIWNIASIDWKHDTILIAKQLAGSGGSNRTHTVHSIDAWTLRLVDLSPMLTIVDVKAVLESLHGGSVDTSELITLIVLIWVVHTASSKAPCPGIGKEIIGKLRTDPNLRKNIARLILEVPEINGIVVGTNRSTPQGAPKWDGYFSRLGFLIAIEEHQTHVTRQAYVADEVKLIAFTIENFSWNPLNTTANMSLAKVAAQMISHRHNRLEQWASFNAWVKTQHSDQKSRINQQNQSAIFKAWVFVKGDMVEVPDTVTIESLAAVSIRR
jgi:hypothetical protein